MKYHGLRGSSNDFFIAFGQTKVKNHEKEHCRNNNAQLAPQIVSSICFSRRQIISLISNDHQRQQSNKKQATLRVVFSITICVLTFFCSNHIFTKGGVFTNKMAFSTVIEFISWIKTMQAWCSKTIFSGQQLQRPNPNVVD